MKKKLYYKFEPNNGEPYIIDKNIENVKAMIEVEYQEIKKEGDEQDIELSISFIWMTDEGFSNLPDAY